MHPYGSFPPLGEGWDGGSPAPNSAGAKPQSASSSYARAIQTAGVRPPLAPIPTFPQKGKEENGTE